MKSLNSLVIIVFMLSFAACKSELREKAAGMKGKTSFNKFILKCRTAAKSKHFNPGFCTDMYNKLLQDSFSLKDEYNFDELFHKYQLKFKLQNYKARKRKEHYQIMKKKRTAKRQEEQDARAEKIQEMQKRIDFAREEAIGQETLESK